MGLIDIYSGDGACGKTSLLNVFTRGYVNIRPANRSWPLQSAPT